MTIRRTAVESSRAGLSAPRNRREDTSRGVPSVVSPPVPIASTDAPGWPRAGTPIIVYADEWGGIGGTANYVVMVASGFARRGYPTTVLVHEVPAMGTVVARLRELGVETLPLPARAGRLGKLTNQAALTQMLRRRRGSLLAMMMGYHTRGGSVALAARLGGIDATVRADLTPPELPLARFEARALRIKDRLVDSVVVGAEENRASFAVTMGRDPRKIHVVNTGIAVDAFQPGLGRSEIRTSLGLSDDDVLIGTMCRLDDRRKGVHDFIEMAGLLAEAWPNTRFVVVGDGVLKPSLAAQANALGLDERLCFAGWAEDTRVWYAAMDIFIMASTHEGGPTTLLEAMAMELPVVATRVGMVPEVVDDGRSGLICPVGNPQALASAVASLVGDADERRSIAAAARTKALADFSVDRMVENYLAVLGQAQAKRRPLAAP